MSAMTPSPAAVTRRQFVGGAVSLAAAVVFASCGDDGPTAAPAQPADSTGSVPSPTSFSDDSAPSGAGESVRIQSIDNTFRPDRVEIAAGTEVVWVNGGRTEHDVLPVEGDEWGVQPEDFPPGAEYRHVFIEPGDVHYYCSIHGTMERGMVGVIVVT